MSLIIIPVISFYIPILCPNSVHEKQYQENILGYLDEMTCLDVADILKTFFLGGGPIGFVVPFP